MADAELNPKDHDEFLVKGLRENDPVVLKSFSGRYLYPLVDFLVHKMGVPWDDAEEIACEIMTKIATQIDQFDPDKGAKFSTWIFGIGKNQAIDYFRKRKRDRKEGISFQSLESVFHTTREQTEEPSISRDPKLKALFLKAFASLSALDQEVLCHAAQGWSYAQIEEVLGKAKGTIKVQAHRARNRLREALKELAGHESVDISDAHWDGLKHWNGEKEVER